MLADHEVIQQLDGIHRPDTRTVVPNKRPGQSIVHSRYPTENGWAITRWEYLEGPQGLFGSRLNRPRYFYGHDAAEKSLAAHHRAIAASIGVKTVGEVVAGTNTQERP